MELTIIQNGALYALQHRPARRYRGNLQKRVDADRISDPPDGDNIQRISQSQKILESKSLMHSSIPRRITGWLVENPPMRTVVRRRLPKTSVKENELVRAVHFGVPDDSVSAAKHSL